MGKCKEKRKWESGSQREIHIPVRLFFRKTVVMDCIFSCEDKAGNKEKYEEKENFVIDRTAPVIEVFL